MKFINIIMLIIWEIFLHSFLATFKVKNAGSMDICDDPKKKKTKQNFVSKLGTEVTKPSAICYFSTVKGTEETVF